MTASSINPKEQWVEISRTRTIRVDSKGNETFKFENKVERVANLMF